MTISKLALTTVWNHASRDHSTPFETASEARLVISDHIQRTPSTDPNLIRLFGQAHSYLDQLTNGECGSSNELASTAGTNAEEISRVLPLAFLAPDIIAGVLNGRQPPELTARTLKRAKPLPDLWNNQRN